MEVSLSISNEENTFSSISGTTKFSSTETFTTGGGGGIETSIEVFSTTGEEDTVFVFLDFFSTTTGTTAVTYTNQHSVLTPANFGLTTFSNGDYNFEFRLISKRAVLPVCASVTVTTIVPPPTPTNTPTPTPTATPTPTPTITITPTPTPTPTIAYDLYLADEYACTFPGCALQRIDVVVALPAGTSPNYGKFYPDLSATGFAYNLSSPTYSGPGIILSTSNFTACNSACIL
jgi:hypothetical protein